MSDTVVVVNAPGTPSNVVVSGTSIGPQGTAGPQGPIGPTGQQGPIGLVGVAFQGTEPSHAQLWADTSTVSAQVAVFDGGTPAQQLTSIKLRRGATSDWPSTLVLDAGEFGYDSTANKFKIGNGSTTWGSLPYVTAVPDLNNPTLQGTITFAAGSNVTGGTITGGTA